MDVGVARPPVAVGIHIHVPPSDAASGRLSLLHWVGASSIVHGRNLALALALPPGLEGLHPLHPRLWVRPLRATLHPIPLRVIHR